MLFILFYLPDKLQRIVVKLSLGVVSNVVLTLKSPFQVLTLRVNSSLVIESTTVIVFFFYTTVRLNNVVSFSEGFCRLFEFSESLWKFVREFVEFSIRSRRTLCFRSLSSIVECLESIKLSLRVLTDFFANHVAISKAIEIEVIAESFRQHIEESVSCAVFRSVKNQPRVAIVVRALTRSEVAGTIGEQEVEFSIFLYLVGVLRLVRNDNTCI